MSVEQNVDSHWAGEFAECGCKSLLLRRRLGTPLQGRVNLAYGRAKK
jgi:hypothetical protein